MKSKLILTFFLVLVAARVSAAQAPATSQTAAGMTEIPLPQVRGPHARNAGNLQLGGWFYETAEGRVALPVHLVAEAGSGWRFAAQTQMRDGRIVIVTLERQGENYLFQMSARPSSGIVRWGLTLDSVANEYYTGIMERVVDGPQRETWAPGRSEALNLRGQTVDMILKPTLSVYAPFYVSSRGYAVFVQGDWPGRFDFAASESGKVKIEFEGSSFAMKIYTASDPALLVRAHALDAGPPFLPPKWMYSPWRWRDEHTQRATYYDGTPVTAPFNSEFMEDVLLMKAYGIPNGVYWIDRPWGAGTSGLRRL